MATVITPNIFRPFDLTANDLIFAGHLVETLKLMITNYEYIFNMDEEIQSSTSSTGAKPVPH